MDVAFIFANMEFMLFTPEVSIPVKSIDVNDEGKLLLLENSPESLMP